MCRTSAVCLYVKLVIINWIVNEGMDYSALCLIFTLDIPYNELTYTRYLANIEMYFCKFISPSNFPLYGLNLFFIHTQKLLFVIFHWMENSSNAITLFLTCLMLGRWLHRGVVELAACLHCDAMHCKNNTNPHKLNNDTN